MGANLLNSSSASVFLTQSSAPSKASKAQVFQSADDKSQFSDVLDSTQKLTREESVKKSASRQPEKGQNHIKAKESHVKHSVSDNAKNDKAKSAESQRTTHKRLDIQKNQKQEENGGSIPATDSTQNANKTANHNHSQEGEQITEKADGVVEATTKVSDEELLEQAVSQSLGTETGVLEQLPVTALTPQSSEVADSSTHLLLNVGDLLPLEANVIGAQQQGNVGEISDKLGSSTVSQVIEKSTSADEIVTTSDVEPEILPEALGASFMLTGDDLVASVSSEGSKFVSGEQSVSLDQASLGQTSLALANEMVETSALLANPIDIQSADLPSGLSENSLIDDTLTLANSLNQQAINPLLSKLTLDQNANQELSVSNDVALGVTTQNSVDREFKLNLDEIMKYAAGTGSTSLDDVSTTDAPDFSQALKGLVANERSTQALMQNDGVSSKPEGLAQSNQSFSGTTGFSHLAGSEVSQANRTFVVQTNVSASVSQPQWSEQVSEKVLWMASQKLQSAEIRLDPPELGPLQVKVIVHQDQAQVSFTSHHAQVREVLDQNLQRLRDMFSEQGMNLVNVDVSDRSFQRQQQGEQQQSGGAKSANTDDEVAESQPLAVSLRLVDHYA